MAIPAGTTNTRNLGAAGVPVTLADGTTAYADMVITVDSTGTPVTGGSSSSVLPAGTDRSGTASTTASALAPSNASRTFLVGQNIDTAIALWINEIGGTATANTAGSYKVPAGQSFSISTNRAVSVIAESGTPKFTATEG